MASITFDTLKFARRLKEAGVPDKQAEAEAEALAEVFKANLEDLATKGDLKELASKRDLREVELRLDSELRLLKWMLGLLLAGVLSLVLKAFFIT